MWYCDIVVLQKRKSTKREVKKLRNIGEKEFYINWVAVVLG